MMIIEQANHPSNTDRTASLTQASMRAIGLEVYRVRGGYLACLPNGKCMSGLFPTEIAAHQAQQHSLSGAA
jgi:hypothetical protein